MNIGPKLERIEALLQQIIQLMAQPRAVQSQPSTVAESVRAMQAEVVEIKRGPGRPRKQQ